MPKKDRADAFIESVYAEGNAGPICNTVMIRNSVILGLRKHRDFKNTVRIEHVWVSPSVRGQGVGKKLMGALACEADARAIALQLRPAAFDRTKGSPTDRKLREWYASFGFVQEPGTNYMLRMPSRQRSD